MSPSPTVLRPSARARIVSAAAIALTAAAALLLQGCTIPGGSTQNPTAAVSTDLIKIATQSEITAKDFDVAIVAGGSAQLAVYSIYDPLYKFDDKGIPQPYLVADYKPNADYTQQEFTLRDDIHFQDGSQMTADDVKFSLDRTAGLTPDLPAPRNKSYLPAIDHIDVTGKLTFTIYTKTSAPLLLNGLAFTSGLIMPKAAVEAAGGMDAFLQHPIGSGPYTFDSLVAGQYLKFTRNDDYWGQKPTFAAAQIFFVSDPAARLARLESGDVDFAAAVDPSQIDTLQSAGFEVQTSPAGNNLAIGLQMLNDPAFSDPKVGQAFNLAVDKDSILKTIYHDTVKPISSLDPTNIATDIAPYGYDPDKAKQLLQDAGWDFSKTLTLAAPTSILLGGDQVAQAVASNLKQIGVNVQIVPMDSATWLQQRQDHSLATDMTLFNLSNSLFNGSGSLSVVTQCADSGFTLWCDPDLDAMIAKAQAVGDIDARRTMEHDIFQYSHDNPSAIFIGQYSVIGAMRPGISWNPTPGQEKVILESFGVK